MCCYYRSVLGLDFFYLSKIDYVVRVGWVVDGVLVDGVGLELRGFGKEALVRSLGSLGVNDEGSYVYGDLEESFKY